MDLYKVKLENFEGPLDLLLFFVRKDELNIYDIPLARITKSYLEYLQYMKDLNLDIAAEFILMAATLMRIKVKMMLPVDPLEEEEEEMMDPREELSRRLIEYRQFKEASKSLAELDEYWRQVYRRSYFNFDLIPRNEEEVYGLKDISFFDLLAAYKKALEKKPVPVFHSVERLNVTVEQQQKFIVDFFGSRTCYLFSELCESMVKVELVVTFLAMLELVKRGEIALKQATIFDDIWIYKGSEFPPEEITEEEQAEKVDTPVAPALEIGSDESSNNAAVLDVSAEEFHPDVLDEEVKPEEVEFSQVSDEPMDIEVVSTGNRHEAETIASKMSDISEATGAVDESVSADTEDTDDNGLAKSDEAGVLEVPEEGSRVVVLSDQVIDEPVDAVLQKNEEIVQAERTPVIENDDGVSSAPGLDSKQNTNTFHNDSSLTQLEALSDESSESEGRRSDDVNSLPAIDRSAGESEHTEHESRVDTSDDSSIESDLVDGDGSREVPIGGPAVRPQVANVAEEMEAQQEETADELPKQIVREYPGLEPTRKQHEEPSFIRGLFRRIVSMVKRLFSK